VGQIMFQSQTRGALGALVVAACLDSAAGYFAPPSSITHRLAPAGLSSTAARCSRQRGASALSRLQLSGSSEDEAKKEAQKWAEMAARMKAQRAAATGASTPAPLPMEGQPGFVPGTGKASLGVDDLQKIEGKVLPAPSMGELESLMAKAEASLTPLQKQRRLESLPKRAPIQPTAAPGGSGSTLKGDKAPARLVGRDAGSLRQAAPYTPGESKVGTIAEGWSQYQIDMMLETEAEWKQQLEAKKEEERAANVLAADAARFTIGADLVSQKGIPTSMESAVVQSLLASVSVMKRGCGRFRIDVDTTGGDETYTTLKNSVPFTRVFSKGLMVNGFSQVRLIFPDVGAAALATRDWAGEDGHVISSFGRSAPEIDPGDDCIVCVAPASSEIQQLRILSEQAAELGLPLILINPSVKSPGGENLGSLGAYTLSLSEFLRTFEYAYYLRTLDWGVILRNYPSDFQIYQEQAGARKGKKYDLLETVSSLPSGDTLERIYLAANPEEAEEGLQAISTGLSRFIDNFSKG